ncbi:MAG TPA: 3-methyl-2-oxobutanoate hydroxymethyltransferase [Anaerolineales bacterium]|nr:3-methyl-2-oxobutanoate hydroxymethyltransferase [Anaerolineales bacterium]
MSTQPAPRNKVTVLTLQQKKRSGEPITMLTCYDYSSAVMLEQAGLDMLLVGDSLGMVVLGHENTLSVTMDDMLRHCKAVARGAKTPFLVGDMPFMSYQVDDKEAVRNAGRLLAEGGMDAVKLEGGMEYLTTVRAIVRAGIPVMGHIGLMPQSANQVGGFKVQGRTALAAKKLLDEALALQSAGCFAIVLEAVPSRVAELIADRLTIPTIGIGAGADTDGQVLVLHDMLGMFDRFTPRFVKQYAHLHQELQSALQNYIQEVRTHQFPSGDHSFTMKEEEWQALLDLLDSELQMGNEM